MKSFFLAALVLLTCQFSKAEELTAPQKEAIKKQFEVIKTWAANKKIIDAVKASNANPEGKDMTQEKWTAAPVLDPVVRSFTKNAAAEELKSLKTDIVTEAFLSNANGTKVAFLNKTTNWSHKGKPKHDEPMAGKDWTGKVEVDESTGSQQVQISVPVKDGDKVIGSLVVGLAVAKLK